MLVNILKAPMIDNILRGLLSKYWRWRIKRNEDMLLELKELKECLQQLNAEDDCKKADMMLQSLNHANSTARLELYKLIGVGGVV